MANICDNTLYAESDDNENIQAIINFFESWNEANVVYEDGNFIEVYFDSKWSFPEKEMNNLFDNIPNKSDIYMRCLSVEWGNYYHAMFVCNNEGWKEVCA